MGSRVWVRLLRQGARFGNPEKWPDSHALVAVCNKTRAKLWYKGRMDRAMAIASSRFGFGPGPQDDPGGDPKAWLKAQLQGPDPGLASGAFAGLPTGEQALEAHRADSAAQHALLRANALQPNKTAQGQFHPQAQELYRADATAQLNFATTTPFSFRERLVWFWTNHFAVSTRQNDAAVFAGPMIREAIRPYVTGNFTDMVLAVERHPAMLIYLDNAHSAGPGSSAGIHFKQGLNENLGRECMELHTVGLAAGYSQADVTSMANILTGWSVATADKGGDATGFFYHASMHEPGPQTVMGHQFDGGEQAGIDALTFLSSYHTTYDLLARKLVIHFVADDPPPGAVKHLAGVLHETKGDLGAASAALVDLPQAWVPAQKLKTPLDYVFSTLRAAPAPAGPKPPDLIGQLNLLGQPVWAPPLPNGWPDQALDWAGSDAIMARIGLAYTYAARFNDAGVDPATLAGNALGPLLHPATQAAMANAGSPREAMTLFLTAPEFQRR